MQCDQDSNHEITENVFYYRRGYDREVERICSACAAAQALNCLADENDIYDVRMMLKGLLHEMEDDLEMTPRGFRI